MGWIDSADAIPAGATVTTSVRRYSQCLESKLVPAVLVGGKPVSWLRQTVTLNTVETVTEVRGLGEAAARALANTAPGNPSDPWSAYVTMSGTEPPFETASRTVEARRVGESGLWRVEKTEKASSVNVKMD